MPWATASTGVAVGDQVALYYITTPPGDPWAARGRPNISPNVTRMGVDVDGAFAEYVLRPPAALIVPRGARPAAGAGRPDGRRRDAAPRAEARGAPPAGRDARRPGRRRSRAPTPSSWARRWARGSSPSRVRSRSCALPASSERTRPSRPTGTGDPVAAVKALTGGHGAGRRHPVRRLRRRRRAGHRDGRARAAGSS